MIPPVFMMIGKWILVYDQIFGCVMNDIVYSCGFRGFRGSKLAGIETVVSGWLSLKHGQHSKSACKRFLGPNLFVMEAINVIVISTTNDLDYTMEPRYESVGFY